MQLTGNVAIDQRVVVDNMLSTVVQQWDGMIGKSVEAKKTFSDIAAQCEMFYSSVTNFMWGQDYQDKYLRMRGAAPLKPRFMVQLQKAFQMVATFGPAMFWQWPARIVTPRKMTPLPPELQALAMSDPQVGPQLTMYDTEAQQVNGMKETQAFLLNQWLNYTPNEQPGGGLSLQSEMAITEALVKGRGCLWVEPYQFPDSDRVITGSFFRTVDHLLIDPDATSLLDAKWIALVCTGRKWELARQYGVPEDEIQGAYLSGNAAGAASADPLRNLHWQQNQSQDVVRYYKVWSKCGMGTRFLPFNAVTEELRVTDEVLRDFVHLVIVPGMKHPLNCHPQMLAQGDDDTLRNTFSWPIETWRDNRWPVNCLDFYPRTKTPWPIAPLAPGLGELTIINLCLSRAMNQVWANSKQIYMIHQEAFGAVQDLEERLKGDDDTVVVKVSQSLNRNLNEIGALMQQPPVTGDIWDIIDRASHSFEVVTGLNELLGGFSQGTQSRSAADANAKFEGANARPQYMANKVERFMTEVARDEVALSRLVIRGGDVMDVVGQTGAMMWDQFVATFDYGQVYRELDVAIEAGGSQRPQRAKEAEALKTFIQFAFPSLEAYRQQTGDPGPINGFISQWGKSTEIDTTHMLLPPSLPPSPPGAEEESPVDESGAPPKNPPITD